MYIKEYQEQAMRTAQYPADVAMAYLALGLAGEAGEVANKIKKVLRGDYDDDPAKAEAALDAAGAELADVLWYVAMLSHELGICLEDLALGNLAKLHMRELNGTIKGSGDDR